MKKEESLQTEVSPTGGLRSTCHFHAVRDQSVSVCSKMTCQKLNHKGERRKIINSPNCVLCGNKVLFSKHFAIVVSWSRSKFAMKPQVDKQKKKGVQNVLENEFSLLLMWKFSHIMRKISFRVFKLTAVEHKHPGFFPHVQDSTSYFPDFSSLLI